MKKLFFLVLTLMALRSSAQNTDYIVSLNGIGPLKIGATKAVLEKTLGKKIQLKNLLDKEGYSDTIKTKFKSIDIILYFSKQYVDENKEDIVLSGIRSSSPLCKTNAGISIGDDKIKVITRYENDMISLWPDYEDDTYTKRSKTKSVINVSADNNDNTIIFYLLNKKVVAFEVTYYEGE